MICNAKKNNVYLILVYPLLVKLRKTCFNLGYFVPFTCMKCAMTSFFQSEICMLCKRGMSWFHVEVSCSTLVNIYFHHYKLQVKLIIILKSCQSNYMRLHLLHLSPMIKS
jgi:hypothetical protein